MVESHILQRLTHIHAYTRTHACMHTHTHTHHTLTHTQSILAELLSDCPYNVRRTFPPFTFLEVHVKLVFSEPLVLLNFPV